MYSVSSKSQAPAQKVEDLKERLPEAERVSRMQTAGFVKQNRKQKTWQSGDISY